MLNYLHTWLIYREVGRTTIGGEMVLGHRAVVVVVVVLMVLVLVLVITGQPWVSFLRTLSKSL